MSRLFNPTLGVGFHLIQSDAPGRAEPKEINPRSDHLSFQVREPPSMLLAKWERHVLLLAQTYPQFMSARIPQSKDKLCNIGMHLWAEFCRAGCGLLQSDCLADVKHTLQVMGIPFVQESVVEGGIHVTQGGWPTILPPQPCILRQLHVSTRSLHHAWHSIVRYILQPTDECSC